MPEIPHGRILLIGHHSLTPSLAENLGDTFPDSRLCEVTKLEDALGALINLSRITTSPEAIVAILVATGITNDKRKIETFAGEAKSFMAEQAPHVPFTLIGADTDGAFHRWADDNIPRVIHQSGILVNAVYAGLRRTQPRVRS